MTRVAHSIAPAGGFIRLARCGGMCALAIMGVLLFVGGCTRPAKIDRPSSQVLNDPAATQPATLVDATDIFEFSPHKGAYLISVAGKPGVEAPYRFEPDKNDAWRLVIEGKRTTYLKLDDDDQFVITREDDLEEGVAVKYEPPIVMLPEELDPASPFEGKCKMTVTNLKDGSAKAKGTCGYTVALVAMQNLITPAGEFPVYLVRTRREMKLTLATSTVVTTTAIAHGRGIVAEVNEQNTRALGFVNVRKVEEMRLAK